MSAVLYDSANRTPGLGAAVGNLVGHHHLFAVLVRRDLRLRYRRSFLGVGWSLLYPMLTSLVLWLVFAQVFEVVDFGMPFVVYLFSGIIVFNLAAQAIQQVSNTLVGYEPVLSRLLVPAEVLAVASATAIAVNSSLAVAPLLALQLVTGVGVPATAPLVVVPLALLTAFAAGIGMLVARAAIPYPDVLPLVGVLLLLLGYLTPTFYPLDVLPPVAEAVVLANPLTHSVGLIRDLGVSGRLGDPWSWAVAVGVAVAAFVLGLRVFASGAHGALVLGHRASQP